MRLLREPRLEEAPVLGHPPELPVDRLEPRIDLRAGAPVELGHPLPGLQRLLGAALLGLDLAQQDPAAHVAGIGTERLAQGAAGLVLSTLGAQRLGHLHLERRARRVAVASLEPRQPAFELQRPGEVAGVGQQPHQRPHRAPVLRTALQQLLVGCDRPAQEPSLTEVARQPRDGQGTLCLVQIPSQQQVLVDADRTADLSLLPVDPRQRQIGVDLVGVAADDSRQHVLGSVELALHDEQQRPA